jgi:signal transduction histidine kinase
MRARSESIRCREAAEIYAAHIDRERHAAVEALSSAASRPEVAAAVRGTASHGAGPLLNIVLAGAPSMTSLSVYTESGHRAFAIGRASPDGPADVAPSALSEIALSHRSSVQQDGSLLVVVPIKVNRGSEGFLAARWGPLNLPTAADRASGSSNGVLITNFEGRGVAEGDSATALGLKLDQDFEPLLRARKSPTGTLVLFEPTVRQRMLAGYAVAKESGLVAMVFAPAETALAPSRFLVRQVAYIVFPAFCLVAIAIWAIGVFYYKQRKLAVQLVKHNARLREVNRAKSDFLANVSHDLRTPLASLRVCLSGLQDPDVHWNDEQARVFLQSASEQTDHLAARVRNLLDMARIESNSHELNTETCDLTDIVASAMDRIRPLLKGRQILTDFPPEPLFVECDQVQVATVILNLLENAVKYSPAGTPIALRGVSEHPFVTVTVIDHGPGVSAPDESRVFEKFYRSPSVASIGGTGLGLAICKSIVEQHEGKIGVRAGASSGAEFWFSLPAPMMDLAFTKGTSH